MLHDLAQAKADQHPIAADVTAAGTLPEYEAAIWFASLLAGNLCCSFSSIRSATMHRRRHRRRLTKTQRTRRTNRLLVPASPGPLHHQRTLTLLPRRTPNPYAAIPRLLTAVRPTAPASRH